MSGSLLHIDIRPSSMGTVSDSTNAKVSRPRENTVENRVAVSSCWKAVCCVAVETQVDVRQHPLDEIVARQLRTAGQLDRTRDRKQCGDGGHIQRDHGIGNDIRARGPPGGRELGGR